MELLDNDMNLVKINIMVSTHENGHDNFFVKGSKLLETFSLIFRYTWLLAFNRVIFAGYNF
jgi:hypothetical protein